MKEILLQIMSELQKYPTLPTLPRIGDRWTITTEPRQ